MTRPGWDRPRSPGTTRALIDVGTEHGLSEERLLVFSGIRRSDLDDPDAAIEGGQELQVVRNLLAGLGDRPGLGLEVGSRFTIGTAGVLGFALLSSSTLRDAVRIVVRFSALSPSYARLDLHEDGRGSIFEYDEQEVPSDAADFLLERDLAALANVLTMLNGGTITRGAGRLELRLEADRARLVAQVIPFLEIEGGVDRTAIVMPPGILDLPLPQADPHTAELCVQQCLALLERRHARRGMAGMVRDVLLRHVGEMPSAATLAKELDLSERTLYRRLEQEGTSVRALRAELHSTLATDLLANAGLTVEEVARRLGYAETASFSRAFKAWTGKNPSTLRA